MTKTSRTITLSALLTLGLASGKAIAADGWGASWSFGPVRPTTSNHIIHTRTTLVPGRLPTWPSGIGPLFIWPGLSNPTSDLVQTTADAWGNNASACGAAAGQWCLEASVFGSFGQRSGPSVSIDPDDHITIDYQLGSDNNTWTQTVTSMKLGKVVSTLTSTSGLMLGGGFGFATEADADSYTIDTQYYLCTEIHLAAADPQFGSTGVGGIGANHGATGTGSGIGTAKNLHTPDGGLTWLVDLITLPAMNPQGTQTAAPTYNCSGTGGTSGTGGAPSTGGRAATGGMAATGGARTGGSPGTGGTRAATGGSPGSGGIVATGGRPSTGGTVNVATGGLNGVGGNLTTGGRPSTGGNVNVATGGTPGTGGLVGNGGTGGALANTGGKTSTSVVTTSATGGSNTMAGSGNSAGGSSPTSGASALAGNSSTTPGSSGDTGSCSCSVPGKSAPRGLFALALAGAALALRSRRRR